MWKQREYNNDKESELIKQGKNRLIARLVGQRKISFEKIDDFLKPDYKNLTHPYCLNDLEKATRLFCDVVKNKGHIAGIFDYDVDGVLSGVMIKELCNIFNIDCSMFFSSRWKHGYGLNALAVEDFVKNIGHIPDLLFVVDSGTNNKKEIGDLKKTGIKHIVVIDHHLPSVDKDKISTNADALISWHLSKNVGEMCAAGEVYQFIRGIRWLTKRVDPIEFLSYAAIATIADVQPIIGDNRIIVKNGLKAETINSVVASGLLSLLEHSKIFPRDLTQEDIIFQIAPKINAAGRLHNPKVAFDLLIEKDKNLSDSMAEYLAEFNEKRKELQKQIEQEAIIMANNQNNTHGILVYNEKWHIGIVGIVASKLTELFNKPVIVVGKHENAWRGSGRSVSNINVKEILDSCQDIFVKYGGHAAAVGVELKDSMLAEASQIFNNACKKYIDMHGMELNNYKYYDAKLSVSAASSKVSNLIKDNLYPYCSINNPQPIFMLPNVRIVNLRIKDGNGWKLVTFNIEKDNVISENPFKIFSSKFGAELEGKEVDIFFNFSQKNYNTELKVIDIVAKRD